jgi:hypothetical protein
MFSSARAHWHQKYRSRVSISLQRSQARATLVGMSTSRGGGPEACNWLGKDDWGEGGMGVARKNADIQTFCMFYSDIIRLLTLCRSGRGGLGLFRQDPNVGKGGGLTVWAAEGSEVDV